MTSTEPAPLSIVLDTPPIQARTSVAVDPVVLITTECITVTSAMRKHARWAQSSVAAILGGSSSGYSNVQAAIPPPNPRSTTHPKTGNMKVDGAAVEARIEAPGLNIGSTNRWGLRGKRGKSIQDNPLIAGFTKLRSELIGCRDLDICNFDTPSLLHPFLQVIRSSSTSGPITSLALIAITKFFSYNFITRNSPRLPLAMQLLASTITHCRFEASDTAHDEVVLLRILKLMERMFSGPCGEVLGDESVCEMMETILSMCCQMRLSEMLRKSAEMSMVVICQVVFERLKLLECEAGAFEQLEQETKAGMDSVKMEPAVNGDTLVPDRGSEEVLNTDGTEEEQHSDSSTKDLAAITSPEKENKLTSESVEEEVEIRPYSLPSMRELLRVLVEILDPHNKMHTDKMRIMALRIIDVAFEVAGPSIAKQPSLARLAKDDLCRHLFQLVRSDTMTILQESLRVAGTLLATTRGVLKLQQELYISYLVACLHPRIEIPKEPGVSPLLYEGVPTTPKLIKPSRSTDISGRSTPVPVKERQRLGMEGGNRRPDAREAMVENIASLVRIPTFMTELYVNYDCDVDRNDLCEDVVGFLSRNAFPDSATWSTTNVPPLCLDALLHYVSFVSNRLHNTQEAEGLPDPAELRKQRDLKQTIIQGASKFNEDPKQGIVFLAQQGIINNVDDPQSIAQFVRGTTRLNKAVLGDYISKRQNEKTLVEFIDQFEFRGKRVDEALRLLLESFRLPGESALIERIVTVFANKYCCVEKPDEVANADAVFVLSYAIIMLNTDQHNPNMKEGNRMKLEQFTRNLRGVNAGQDFDPEYLHTIFTAIKTKEIILPDEHDNKDAFDYAWKELLIKAETASDLVITDTNIYDADMFAKTWRPIIATLSYVFMSATDDAVFSRVITGFDQCAQIAAKYQLTECMDRIVQCLGIISTLPTECSPSTALNTEMKVNDSSIMVSELAVKFGRDFKAQLATVVLFRVISGNEAVLRNGWTSIMRCCLNLFINSLIPSYFSETQTALGIGPIPLQSPSVVIDRNGAAKESGLFSALSSYLSSYASDEPPEPSEEELESTLCAVDCVNSCFLGDIFANIMNLDIEPLTHLVKFLLALLPEEGTSLIIHKPDPSTIPSTVNTTFVDKNPKYDPAVVYVLELATCLALRDQDTITAVGKQVTDSLQSVIRAAQYAHHTIVSRAIYYLLSLLEQSYEHTFVRTPVILHHIATLDRTVLEKSSLPIIAGITKCLRGPTSLKSQMVISPDFWMLLRGLLTVNDAAQEAFECMEYVSKEPNNISSDNYVAIVALLNDFALQGSVGSVFEQKQDKILLADRKKGVSTVSGGASKTKLVQLKDRPDAAVVTRAVRAVALIYNLTTRVPILIAQSHLEKKEAWSTYWSPIFQSLGTQCANPCREVRNAAFTALQRALLSPELTTSEDTEHSGHHEWTAIFGDVLFPLISRLLKPEVYQSDPRGMGETRVQAAMLLCKVFLHYLIMLAEWEGVGGLWGGILDVMDRLMNSGQGGGIGGGGVEEAVRESLKNVLLVMNGAGLLIAPVGRLEEEDEVQRRSTELWEQTEKRLERFLPSLMMELFPPPQPQPEEKITAPVTAAGEAVEVAPRQGGQEVTEVV